MGPTGGTHHAGCNRCSRKPPCQPRLQTTLNSRATLAVSIIGALVKPPCQPRSQTPSNSRAALPRHPCLGLLRTLRTAGPSIPGIQVRKYGYSVLYICRREYHGDRFKHRTLKPQPVSIALLSRFAHGDVRVRAPSRGTRGCSHSTRSVPVLVREYYLV